PDANDVVYSKSPPARQPKGAKCCDPPVRVCPFRTARRPDCVCYARRSSRDDGTPMFRSGRRLHHAPRVMSEVEQPPPQAPAPTSEPPASAGASSVSADVSTSPSLEQQRLDEHAYLQHALAVSVIGVWHVDIATGAQWW